MHDTNSQDWLPPSEKESPGSVDGRTLEMLVCPLTKEPLRIDRQRNELISKKAQLAYPIREGVPIMLVDKARKLTKEEADAY